MDTDALPPAVYVATLEDDEARALCDTLIAELFRTKKAFADHYGMTSRAVFQWSDRRPPTWALVALLDRKEAAQHADAVKFLKLAKAALALV